MTRNKIFLLTFLALIIIANTFVLINLQDKNAEIGKKLKKVEKEEIYSLGKFIPYFKKIRLSNIKNKNIDAFDKIEKAYDILNSDSSKIYDPYLKKELYTAFLSSEDFKNIKIKDFNSNILTLWSIGMEMAKMIENSNGYPQQRLIIENLKKSSDGKISFSLSPIGFCEIQTGLKIFNEKNQVISTRSAFIYSGDYTKLIAEIENPLTKEKIIYTNKTESHDEE